MRLGLLITLAVICQISLAADYPTIYLNGSWKFHPGDDLAWAQPDFDDGNWQALPLPGTWEDASDANSAWYRRTINISQFPRQDLGLQIGAIRNAYEVYVDGKRLGAVGKLPPDPEINYDLLRVYRVPPDLTTGKDSMVIALRVWGGSDLSIGVTGAGPYSGTFALGNYTRLVRELDAAQVPRLIFASMFLLAGAYFLYLHLRTRAIPAFFWFGCTSLVLALYIVTQTQWKYGWELNFLTMEKIEAISFLLFLASITELIWKMIERPIPRFMRIIQAVFVLLAGVYVLAPSLDVHYVVRPFWQALIIINLIPVMWIVVREARVGNDDARLLLYGFCAFTIAGINDLMISLNLHPDMGLRLVPLGFLAILIAMGASLAGKFKVMLTSLEQQVAARTEELSRVNRELAQANNSLVEMTRIDPLTGVLNRRGLTSEAEIERQRFIRQREPFALVIADIDHFKQFNDQYGHACGDKVLTAVAEIFRAYVRDVDRVARWGGEEFVLLFPGTDQQGVENIADKLRQKIEQFELDFENRLLKVTMTFGGAVYHADESIDECLVRADTALYQGKAAGRNRVVIAP